MFSKLFFETNRKKLSNLVPNSLLVIPAHVMLQYSADEPYDFRQESNFWYLTGISEPDLLLVINTRLGECTLLIPKQNDYQIEWDGAVDTEAYKKKSGISNFATTSELITILEKAKKDKLQIATLLPLADRVEPYGFYANPARKLLQQEICKVETEPKDIRQELAVLRQNKSIKEIEAIRQAIDITGEALLEIKNNLQMYANEKEIATKLQINFLKFGADGHKFSPIVASGANAAIIHYKNNNQSIQKNNGLLLDVGARVGMYGADISRVYKTGNPSKKFKAVYEALLEVHNNALGRVKPGVSFKYMQEKVNEDLKKNLQKIHVDFEKLPHGLSHFLGIDTHDAGDYTKELTPNSVITIEPGIYLPNEGIGVRIEDDVLVTETGSEVLSKNISYEL